MRCGTDTPPASKEGKVCSGSLPGPGGASGTYPSTGGREAWDKLGQRNRVRQWEVPHLGKAPPASSLECSFHEAGVGGFLGFGIFFSFPPRALF